MRGISDPLTERMKLQLELDPPFQRQYVYLLDVCTVSTMYNTLRPLGESSLKAKAVSTHGKGLDIYHRESMTCRRYSLLAYLRLK